MVITVYSIPGHSSVNRANFMLSISCVVHFGKSYPIIRKSVTKSGRVSIYPIVLRLLSNYQCQTHWSIISTLWIVQDRQRENSHFIPFDYSGSKNLISGFKYFRPNERGQNSTVYEDLDEKLFRRTFLNSILLGAKNHLLRIYSVMSNPHMKYLEYHKL